MSTTMTLRLEDDVNEWQIREIKAAVKEADAGEFASDAKLAARVRKWSLGSGQAFLYRRHLITRDA